MKRVLVTGAPGFLGSHLCAALRDEGVEVRGLALDGEPTANLDGLDVEIVRGDVLDAKRMREVVRGVDTVFHGAAIYADGMADPTPMYAVNLRGTYHVLEACRRERSVRRVVYTASVVSLGRSGPGRLADEDTPYDAWEVDFHYSRSKLFSRWIADSFHEWGLDVRTVCPAAVLGPGDLRPTPSARMILSVVRGEMPGYVDGGASFVDVRDAALCHVRAATRGRSGARYVASGHNLSMGDFMDRVWRTAHGRPRRFLRMPAPVGKAAVSAMERIAALRGTEPPLTRAFLDYSLRHLYFDNARATDELGMTWRPFEETIGDALDDFRQRGLLPRP
ncbi:MAG: NAD-dependent epimerase/dehydratase family protein [Deltaproteobacteria bacterium]|nr:MAG: NAD-dependent epimerase/dehydratase family protein [Deltaproteobacteria bacterium]